ASWPALHVVPPRFKYLLPGRSIDRCGGQLRRNDVERVPILGCHLVGRDEFTGLTRKLQVQSLHDRLQKLPSRSPALGRVVRRIVKAAETQEGFERRNKAVRAPLSEHTAEFDSLRL